MGSQPVSAERDGNVYEKAPETLLLQVAGYEINRVGRRRENHYCGALCREIQDGKSIPKGQLQTAEGRDVAAAFVCILMRELQINSLEVTGL
jgi:hypothetical protein